MYSFLLGTSNRRLNNALENWFHLLTPYLNVANLEEWDHCYNQISQNVVPFTILLLEVGYLTNRLQLHFDYAQSCFQYPPSSEVAKFSKNIQTHSQSWPKELHMASKKHE